MIPLIQRNIPKFSFLKRQFGNRPFLLLDIGSGNHSASKTKKLFPNCEYHGVDMQKDYNNDEQDYQAMTAFYGMDLTALQFDAIPDNTFDAIRMTHIIEHLHNGDDVIRGLLPKLKKGGIIYIEFPGIKSTKLPSMQGTLNFYDDATHVRIFSAKEVEGVVKPAGFSILSSGTRRSLLFILAMPFSIVLAYLKGKKPQGPLFWDILGFAEYVLAKK